MSTNRPTPAGPRIGRVAVVIALLVVASTGLIVAVGTQHTEQEPLVQLPAAVVAVLPEPGAVGFRQDVVGADLRTDYLGTVAIDGRDIPLDQVTVQEMGTVRRISYQPGDGRAIGQLEPGAHTATVYWWGQAEPAPDRYDRSVDSFSWSFTVG
jgi:hypothetical protein